MTAQLCPYPVITEELVEKYLTALDIDKSIELDGFPPLVLKHCAKSLSKPLQKRFVRSFDQYHSLGIWPTLPICIRREANFSLQIIEPISLNSTVSKVMERIIKDTMMKHLQLHGLISAKQHGFLPKKSTVTNLIEFTDRITNSLTNNQCTDVAFLDFVKAFDRVPHEKLLHKLQAYGFTGQLFAWIRAFLSDRKQRVVLDHAHSPWSEVSSGVIQGSF
jgi:hypothetical protein